MKWNALKCVFAMISELMFCIENQKCNLKVQPFIYATAII